MNAAPEEAREFARVFRDFLTWVHQDLGSEVGNEVVTLVRGHLGPDGLARSVVARTLPAFEHVNVQVALDAWSVEARRSVEVHGVSVPPHHGGLTLQQLLTGDGLPPLRLGAPELVDLPSAPRQTRACLRRGLLLVEDARGRYAVLVRGPEEHHEPVLNLEVAGLPIAEAQTVLEELAELRLRLNVYRGQVVELVAAPSGGVGFTFAELPRTDRADVILPEAVLQRVERHTAGIAAHRQALLAAGQHLKRGLLLYGPPGTGKTHTLSYLLGAMRGRTTVILSGAATGAIGQAGTIARALQPATIVIEDVDLIGMDRMLPGGDHNAILFQLLNEMDGLASDADVLFVLTTNRVDMLEPALTARPGRIDQAIEIALPDRAARRQLLDLYLSPALDDATADEIAERTDGVAAAFIKELARRATLTSIRTGAPVSDTVGPSLTALVEQSAPVLRRSLAAAPTPEASASALDGSGWRPAMAPWADGSF